MIFYLFLLTLIVLIFVNDKVNKRSLFFIFLLLTLLFALRKSTVGQDTWQFVTAYSAIRKISLTNHNLIRFEIGFFVLCKLLNYISKDSQTLLVVTALITNIPIYFFIKDNSKNYRMASFLYITMNIFLLYQSMMREAMAIAVLVAGYKYIKNNNYIKFLIVVIIASLFHVGAWAVLLIPVYKILLKDKKGVLLVTLIAIFVFLFYKQLFSFLTSIFGYKGYQNSQFGKSNYFGSLLGALEVLFSYLWVMMYIPKIKLKEIIKKEDTLVATVVLFITFSFLVTRMTIFNRVSCVYQIFSLIALPNLIEEIESEKIKKETEILICIIYLVSFILIQTLRPGWYSAIDYKFFWN